MSAPENPPAFPRTGEGFGNPNYDTPGMTLRDWFAGKVLGGASSDDEPIYPRDGESTQEAIRRHWSGVAEAAYLAADAMLAERAKGERS